MKKVSVGLCVIVAFLLGYIAPAFTAESNSEGYSPGMKAKIEEMKKTLRRCSCMHLIRA
jgi:hypothetical protein